MGLRGRSRDKSWNDLDYRAGVLPVGSFLIEQILSGRRTFGENGGRTTQTESGQGSDRFGSANMNRSRRIDGVHFRVVKLRVRSVP